MVSRCSGEVIVLKFSLFKKIKRRGKEKKKEERYGFMLIQFGDLGPEVLSHESTPLGVDEMSNKSIMLGVYLQIIMGQSNQPEGLFGPIPWNETPDHLLLTYSFKAHNPFVQTPKLQAEGVPVFFVIFLQRDDQELVKARFALEQTLDAVFRKNPTSTNIEVSEQNSLLYLSQVKNAIQKTVAEGQKLLQERYLDEILSYQSLSFLALLSMKTKEVESIIVNIRGTTEDNLLSAAQVDSDIVVTDLGANQKITTVQFAEYSKIAVAVFDLEEADESFHQEEFVEFIRGLELAIPLLAVYF